MSYSETARRLFSTMAACSRSIDSARLVIGTPSIISSCRFSAAIAMKVGSACISTRSDLPSIRRVLSTGGGGRLERGCVGGRGSLAAASASSGASVPICRIVPALRAKRCHRDSSASEGRSDTDLPLAVRVRCTSSPLASIASIIRLGVPQDSPDAAASEPDVTSCPDR